MRRSRLESLLDALPQKVEDLIANAHEYRRRFNETEPFGGPSLHFHHRALEPGPLEGRADALYAMLTSWGMHRLAKGGPKMVGFQDFLAEILRVEGEIAALASVTFQTADHRTLERLVRLAKGLRAMRTAAWLVANSKVLAHLLPDLVGPIDRAFTLGYVLGKPPVEFAPHEEEMLFRRITSEFYWPVARDPRFKSMAAEWLNRAHTSWDTSLLKIVDNAVVGARGSAQAWRDRQPTPAAVVR